MDWYIARHGQISRSFGGNFFSLFSFGVILENFFFFGSSFWLRDTRGRRRRARGGGETLSTVGEADGGRRCFYQPTTRGREEDGDASYAPTLGFTRAPLAWTRCLVRHGSGWPPGLHGEHQDRVHVSYRSPVVFSLA